MSSFFTPKPTEVFEGLQSLQKFQCVSKYNKSALRENYLWFSTLSSFNDPFEGLYSYRPIISPDLTFNNMCMWPQNKPGPEEIRLRKLLYDDERAFYAEVERLYREWYDSVAKRVGEKGYFCFFSTPKSGPEKSPEDDMLMWGHYTNGFRGYRLNFDPDLLLSALGDDVDAYPIEYLDDPVPLELDSLYHHLVISPSGPRYRCAHEESMFRTKSSHWRYESELRLRREAPGRWDIPSGCIASVDFGDRMTGRQISEIQSLVKAHNPDVRFNRAVPSKSHYRIELIPQPDVSG